MDTKHCVVCGVEFAPNSNRQKYCLSCTRYAGTANCKNCGKEFRKRPGTTGQFCSRQCFNAHRTMPEMVRRACIVCGQEFKPRHKEQTTCSHDCDQRRRRTERLRICPVCGKQFDYGTHRHKLTCSKECAGVQRRKGPMVSRCERCGKEIRRTSDRYRRFCSRECLADPIGTRYPTTGGYIRMKVGKGQVLILKDMSWNIAM